MKNKKKKIIIIISSVICVPILIVALILTIRGIVHFPARPAWAIEQYFLSNTPLGSTYDEVYKFLNGCDKSKNIVVYENHGFVYSHLTSEIGTVYPSLKEDFSESPWLEVIGVKAIEVDVGSCIFPIPYSVQVYFAFDEEGKLIKVCYDQVSDWP